MFLYYIDITIIPLNIYHNIFRKQEPDKMVNISNILYWTMICIQNKNHKKKYKMLYFKLNKLLKYL